MLRATVFVLLLSFALSHGVPAEPERDWRIIGGTDAPQGSANYQASINSLLNTHFCGGAILNARTIVTAAQCFIDPYIATSIIVVVGTYTLNSDSGASYAVSKIKTHPSFDPEHFTNDIALVITRHPMVLGGNVQAIPLSIAIIAGDVSVTLTGWGSISYPSPVFQTKLQILNLKTIELTQCKSDITVDASHICTLAKVGEGRCFGDGGSPLVAGGKLVGITSWGVKCAAGSPDVYTRISFFVPWINANKE